MVEVEPVPQGMLAEYMRAGGTECGFAYVPQRCLTSKVGIE
jgi:acyl CoA:acetate/3-ketoacid CoA transferase alpha subunit